MSMQETWLNITLENAILADCEVIFSDYEGALSQPEKLDLKILSSTSHSAIIKALHQAVKVTLQNSEQSWTLYLQVFNIQALLTEELLNRTCFLIELRSPVFALTQTSMTPVLKNLTLAQTCDLILTGRFTGLAGRTLQPYRFALEALDVNQPLSALTGLNESLYTVFQRILSRYGLSYYFDHADEGMMVISDHIAKFAEKVTLLQGPHSAGELLTRAHEDEVSLKRHITPGGLFAAGHPRALPEVLISSDSASAKPLGLSYQINHDEYEESQASAHAMWMRQAKEGAAHRQYHTGGGVLFSGAVDERQQALFVATAFRLEFDGHEEGRIRAISTQATSQPLLYPYRDAPHLAENCMLIHGGAVSSRSGNVNESMSVNNEGHYHMLLPDYVSDNASDPLLDTRMVYPMHSDDHSQHYTLMNNAEGLLLYSAGSLGESLLLGTANSEQSQHLTREETAQNMYWQDDSHNRTAFINEGPYERNTKTGRHTATIMEAPRYHPDGSGSYVRMGDTVAEDAAYPAQAGEGGIYLATSGHQIEEHQGGLLHLSGNAGSDFAAPLPINREMTELNPVATPHILQSSTAKLHQESYTASSVTHIRTLTEGTLSEVLSAPQLVNTWSSDNSRQVFVSQNLQQTGKANNIALNTQNRSVCIKTQNVTQSGTKRTDQFTQKTITRNHRQNLETYQSLQKNTTQTKEQISTQNLNVQNYTRTSQTGVIQMREMNVNAGVFNTNLASAHFAAVNMQGHASSADVAAAAQAQAAKTQQRQQQQDEGKREIVWLLDDPSKLLPSLHSNVNQQANKSVSPNSKTIYPLSDNNYKTGPIALTWQADFGALKNIVYPQIRQINVYDTSLEMQLPKPYFNQNGQMGMYLGARDAATNIDLGTIPGESNQQFLLLASDDAPSDLFSTSFQVELMINTAADDVVNWLGDKLKQYIVTADSETVADHVGTLAYFAKQNNRAFLTALVKDSVVKVSQTSNAKGALLFLEVETGILKDQQYPFKEFVQSATTTWLRLVDWSKELTPVQQAATKAAQTAEKPPATLKGVAKSWPLIEILIMGTVDRVQFSESQESVEWLMEHWINDAFKVIAIAALVYLFMITDKGKAAVEFIGAKIISKVSGEFFTHWIANSLVGGFASGLLNYAAEKLRINDALANSTLAQETYKKATTAYEAISNSDMIQMIRLVMKDVQNPQTIETGLDNTDWEGTIASDYQNQAASGSSNIPTWTNPGEGGF